MRNQVQRKQNLYESDADPSAAGNRIAAGGRGGNEGGRRNLNLYSCAMHKTSPTPNYRLPVMVRAHFAVWCALPPGLISSCACVMICGNA